jgi:hypothetical protein
MCSTTTQGNWLLVFFTQQKTKTRDDCQADVNPVKNNETQQRKGTQDHSTDRFEWKTSTRCL